MLVEHDVEAELVRQLPLVVIAVEQIGGDVRIAFAIEEIEAQRAGMLGPGRIIGLLGELVDFHGAYSCCGVIWFSRTPAPFRQKFWAARDRGNARRGRSPRTARPRSFRNRRGRKPR